MFGKLKPGPICNSPDTTLGIPEHAASALPRFVSLANPTHADPSRTTSERLHPLQPPPRSSQAKDTTRVAALPTRPRSPPTLHSAVPALIHSRRPLLRVGCQRLRTPAQRSFAVLSRPGS